MSWPDRDESENLFHRYSTGTEADYTRYFAELLGGQKMREAIVGGKDPRQVTAIDLMGYGIVFRDVPIGRPLGVALSDPRFSFSQHRETGERLSEYWQRVHKSGDQPIDIVEGDVLAKRTWEKISTWLGEKKVDTFICRPLGAWQFIPDNLNTYSFLMQLMWERLTDENGTIFLELPKRLWYDFRTLDAWIEKCQGLQGVSVISGKLWGHTEPDVPPQFIGLGIKLTKNKGAPEVLPKFKHPNY